MPCTVVAASSRREPMARREYQFADPDGTVLEFFGPPAAYRGPLVPRLASAYRYRHGAGGGRDASACLGREQYLRLLAACPRLPISRCRNRPASFVADVGARTETGPDAG